MFDYDNIPEGFYQTVIESGHPVRRCWHLQKFERIIDCLPRKKGMSILDVGCFAGTFLSLLPEDWFSEQVGIDIIKKQIRYADKHFKTPFREFHYVPKMESLSQWKRKFDCITLIEVIEHLPASEISKLLLSLVPLLKEGGHLIISTPNYSSSWPGVELIVNHLSEVSYEEQHLTKFNYFTVVKRLFKICPELKKVVALEMKTTTHFVTPFLAAFSIDFANKLSRLVPHQQWRFPFGNLIVLKFRKNAVDK